jgi:YD repeat-containing protein
MPTNEVGATPGSFSVTDRGQASYSIPLQVPPGRLGVQPNLALQYLSTKADGMLGIGWSLTGLSTITRCRRFLDRDSVNAAVRFNASDRFCLDGQALFQIGGGVYGHEGVEYRTEVDSFSKIVSHGSTMDGGGRYVGPEWFEVRTKDGRILTYGKEGSSTVDVSFPTGTPGNRGQVIRVWALNRVEDRAGNYLDIAYKKYQSVVVPADGQGNPNAQIASTGEILPATISYGGNNSDRAFAHAGHDHSRFVRFSYGNRPDPTHHYASGVQGYSRKRLERVDTFVGKVFVKSYVLRYEDMLDASKLPPFQLEEVQECSDDATGERKCLPATEFRYYLQQDFGPLQSVGTGCPFNYTALTGGGRDGFVCDSVGVNPVDIDGNGAEEGSLWKFADVTGDGLKDRYECIETAGRTTFDIQVNLGGFEFAPVAHVNIAIPPALVPVSMRCDDLIVMDADSDGDDDFLMGTSAVIVGPPEHQVQGNAGMYRLSLTPASGNTFVGEWVLATPTGLHLRRPGPTGVCCEPPNQQILDFNGDGLKDIIALESGRFLLWTNTGVGFDVQALTGDEFNGGLWDSIVMDYDGDGREDIVFTGGTWFRYAGPGAIERRALSVPPNAGRGAMLFDEDGDGSPGLFHPNLLGPHGELRTWGSSFSARSRLLHSVTDGVGKRVTVKYDGDSAFGRTLNLGTCVPTSITKCGNKVGPLVSETELSQLRSESTPARERLLSYQYFGSTIGLRGRGSFGFTRRVVASPLHQTEYLYNTSDFVRAGRATEITTTPRNAMPSPLGDEERFETTTLQWGIFHSGAQQPFPFLSRQVRTVYNGFSEPSIVGRDDLIRDPPDVFGNETSVTSASVSSSTIVDVTTTVTHWFNDPDLWVIGLADDVTIASTRGDTDTRFIDYGYDLNRRLLTNISRQGGPPGAFDPAQHRHTTLTRDDFGNIDETCVGDISLITRCGRVLERDNENVFATRLEDAQGMQSEYIFALEDGQLLAAMDPNGILSERGFDAFGRPQQVRSPTANGSFTYAHEDQTVSAFLFNVRGAISLTSNFAGTGPRKTVFDAFGRVVQTQVPGFGGAVVYTDRQYDNLGRLTVESVPHTPANIAEGLIDYHYDGVGRLSKITQPDGNATEYFYTNIQAANFDFTLFIGDHPATLSMVKLPRGNTRLTVRDASGMVSFTAEAPLVSRAGETHTTFKHGPFGALTEVFAPQGRTTYDNDDWGRTRVVSDPALGMRILTYNGFDERVRETDARGEVNVYDYDRLGRLVEKRNDAGDVIARWDFDGPPELNQQGRLVGSWRRSSADLEDAEGTWVLNHYEGPNGLPSAVVYHVGATIDDPLGGEVFATQVSYDESVPGRLSGVTYPSNGGAFRIAYDYDSEPAGDAWIGSGAIRSVAPADEQGPTGDAYWTLTAADEGYRLAEERFGNDVVSTRTYYDPGECANDPGVSCAGRLKEITTDLPGETRFANHPIDDVLRVRPPRSTDARAFLDQWCRRNRSRVRVQQRRRSHAEDRRRQLHVRTARHRGQRQRAS